MSTKGVGPVLAGLLAVSGLVTTSYCWLRANMLDDQLGALRVGAAFVAPSVPADEEIEVGPSRRRLVWRSRVAQKIYVVEIDATRTVRFRFLATDERLGSQLLILVPFASIATLFLLARDVRRENTKTTSV